jgi:hypothetical protein
MFAQIEKIPKDSEGKDKTYNMGYYIVSKGQRVSPLPNRKNQRIKTKVLDFVSLEFGVQRVDSHEIRQKILSIPYIDWKKLGFSRGTLHY